MVGTSFSGSFSIFFTKFLIESGCQPKNENTAFFLLFRDLFMVSLILTRAPCGLFGDLRDREHVFGPEIAKHIPGYSAVTAIMGTLN